MKNSERQLIGIRKEFERWGLQINNENLLERSIPSYFKADYYEQKREFVEKSGYRIAHSDDTKGISLVNPQLFREMMGGGKEIAKIPNKVFDFLRVEYCGRGFSFYFWFDYSRLSARLHLGEIEPQDVFSIDYEDALTEYKLKKMFHKEEAREILKENLSKQLDYFKQLVNENKKWEDFQKIFEKLIDSAYESLLDEREEYMALPLKPQTISY